MWWGQRGRPHLVGEAFDDLSRWPLIHGFHYFMRFKCYRYQNLLFITLSWDRWKHFVIFSYKNTIYVSHPQKYMSMAVVGRKYINQTPQSVTVRWKSGKWSNIWHSAICNMQLPSFRLFDQSRIEDVATFHICEIEKLSSDQLITAVWWTAGLCT